MHTGFARCDFFPKVRQMKPLTAPLLKIIGALLLLAGLVAAYYGPLEIHVFALFSEGGRFHYEGFGFGSFWFATLVLQNFGYYAAAALLIPVGLGHLRLRRWALTLTRLYAWFWLVGGLTLIGNLLTLIPPGLQVQLPREILLPRILWIGIFAVGGLVFAPLLVRWLYHRKSIQAAFEAHDPNRYWTERTPLPLLALYLLFIILILVFHLAIFYRGIFPFFGQVLLDRQGVYLLSLCTLLAGILLYGLLTKESWAWWGAVVFLTALAGSSLLTFMQHTFYDLILAMTLPPFEMDFLNKLTPIHGFRFTGLVGPPLLIALSLLLHTKEHFTTIKG